MAAAFGDKTGNGPGCYINIVSGFYLPLESKERFCIRFDIKLRQIVFFCEPTVQRKNGSIEQHGANLNHFIYIIESCILNLKSRTIIILK